MRFVNLDQILSQGLLSSGFLATINKICEMLDVKPNMDILIFECDTLLQFHEITKRPYNIGAIYSNGLIITQPFRILISKGVLEKTILHEVLHHLLQRNFNLPEWLEEGFILFVLGTKPHEVAGRHKNYLERFISEVRYEDIPNLFNNYRTSNHIKCNRLGHFPGQVIPE